MFSSHFTNSCLYEDWKWWTICRQWRQMIQEQARSTFKNRTCLFLVYINDLGKLDLNGKLFFFADILNIFWISLILGNSFIIWWLKTTCELKTGLTTIFSSKTSSNKIYTPATKQIKVTQSDSRPLSTFLEEFPATGVDILLLVRQTNISIYI